MRYVVVGGGIAGVCCALELARCLQQQLGVPARPPGREPDAAAPATHAEPVQPDDDGVRDGDGNSSGPHRVVLVSSSSVIKGVREVARLSRLVEELEVVESPLSELAEGSGGLLHVVLGCVVGLDLQARSLRMQDGNTLAYDKLCLCTGARPKALAVPGAPHPAVLTLRDTDSVQDLARRLRGCRRLVLVGNGGIALELAGALTLAHQPQPLGQAPGPSNTAAGSRAAAATAGAREGPDDAALSPAGPAGDGLLDKGTDPELVWVLKHGHIGDAFFDVDAAAFLLERLAGGRGQQGPQPLAARDPDTGHQQQVGPACLQSAQPGPAPDDELGAAVATGTAADPRVARIAGHAAGPTWTRELLRGLHMETGTQSTDHTAAGGAAAGGPRDTQQSGRGSSGPSASAAAGAMSGGKSGSNDREIGGGGGAFKVVLEFSATVTSICAGAGGMGSGGGHGGKSRMTAATPCDAPADAPPADPPPAGAVAASDTATGVEPAGSGGQGPAAENGAPAPASEHQDWALYVTLSNGKVYGADLVVVGIGVEPNTEWLPQQLQRAPDGGLVVAPDMRTSDPDVFAAGDCCTADWGSDVSPHWFQMRLWTQARLMGTYAAHCMLGVADDLASGFNFELFTHVTRFLGCKVVFLGRYNGQGLQGEFQEKIRLYSRVGSADVPIGSFVRVLMLRDRMQGAVLIGDTDLEEAYENLILDGLDLSAYGAHIVDEDFELEHHFD